MKNNSVENQQLFNNNVEYQVSGVFAMFTDPHSSGNGIVQSSPIPTYGVIKGITESIYWIPGLNWVIDEITVMNQIKTNPMGMIHKNRNGEDEVVRYYYLKDVRYLVKAHFEWDKNPKVSLKDKNVKKYQAIMNRAINAGGRKNIFLGKNNNCAGIVGPCCYDEEKEGSAYKDVKMLAFGKMFHGFTYENGGGRESATAHYWYPVMKNGVIRFIRPEECEEKYPHVKKADNQFVWG